MSVAVAKAKTNGSGKAAFELLSISKLAFRFDLDRATVRTRLHESGIEPASDKAKEKLYELTPRLETILDQSNTKLTAAKLQKELANARLAELKVGEAEGDLIQVSEVEDYLQRLFKALYQEAVTRYPKRIAAQIGKAKTPAAAAEILTAGLGKIFNTVREDHGQLLIGKRK